MPLTLVLPVSYGLPPRNVPANHPVTTSEELVLDRHRKHPMANVVQTVSRQNDDAISHGGMAGSAARSGIGSFLASHLRAQPTLVIHGRNTRE